MVWTAQAGLTDVLGQDPASSVCYARSGRYLAQTQDVGDGLGPAKAGSDAVEVEPLGGRGRSRRDYPAVACSLRGWGRTWPETHQNTTLWVVCVRVPRADPAQQPRRGRVWERGGENSVDIMGLRI